MIEYSKFKNAMIWMLKPEPKLKPDQGVWSEEEIVGNHSEEAAAYWPSLS